MGKIMREPGWESRLHTMVEAAADQKFRYGTFDCCLFAADVVKALTGVDPAGEAWRDQYDNEKEARERMAELGYEDEGEIIEEVLEAHGFTEILPAFATRGDIALLEVARGKSAGVFYGGEICVPMIDGGLRFFPRAKAIKCWRIE